MKVEDKRQSGTRIADIYNGECFINNYDGDLYMKIEVMERKEGDFVNCINLEAGETSYLNSFETVEPVNVKAVIE